MEYAEPKQILVTDDSATMRMLVSLTLRRMLGNVRVSEAVNGADALAKLSVSDYDLLITDMQMPVMDGPELIRSVRSGPKGHIPILIITTLGDGQDRDFGVALGADGYITKPVNGHQLKELVSRFLSGDNVKQRV